MALTKWEPANDVESLQSDFNRFFEGFFGRPVAGSRRWAPPMDLSETEDALVLRADLPGLDRDDVSIEIKDNVLTVSGERRPRLSRCLVAGSCAAAVSRWAPAGAPR